MCEKKMKAVELTDDELDTVTGGKGLFTFLRKNNGQGKKNAKHYCQFCGAEIENGAPGKAWLCESCRSKTQVQL